MSGRIGRGTVRIGVAAKATVFALDILCTFGIAAGRDSSHTVRFARFLGGGFDGLSGMEFASMVALLVFLPIALLVAAAFEAALVGFLVRVLRAISASPPRNFLIWTGDRDLWPQLSLYHDQLSHKIPAYAGGEPAHI